MHLYFQTKLYTANDSGQAITFDGSENMSPNWVWIKSRTDTNSHNLWDSVRGVNKYLEADTTKANTTVSNGVTSFDANGFTVGNRDAINDGSLSFASWNWKAGTSFSNDASATGVGTIDSAGSINTTAGFSIITWTGNATSSSSVAHGLGAVPKAIFTKNLDNGSQPWKCYFSGVGNAKYLQLNTADEPATSGVWSSTTPTSSIINISNDTGINGSGNTILAYCFTDIKGYSKCGSYTGNGNASGAFIFTGFRPAFILTKGTHSGGHSWNLLDTKRNTFNPADKRITPDTSNTEATTTQYDILSNGFKAKATTGAVNTSGATYVYLAFAESPFVNSNGVPNNAR